VKWILRGAVKAPAPPHEAARLLLIDDSIAGAGKNGDKQNGTKHEGDCVDGVRCRHHVRAHCSSHLFAAQDRGGQRSDNE
jgi:hypothetical protein